MTADFLKKLGLPELPLKAEPFRSPEDNAPYRVWKLEYPRGTCVLKEAKAVEAQLYACFFNEPNCGAPQIFRTIREGDREYLLMEYVPGEDLCRCTREALTLALDALIRLQREYWQNTSCSKIGNTFESSLQGRCRRREYLRDEKLVHVYDAFLQEYARVPRTLCHDDLLPFNAIHCGDRVVFIDWEWGGILPYAASLARLIAHAEEKPDAIFFMKEEDKAYAAQYYYEQFIREMNISWEEYVRTLKLFVFYEYCEWVYLGNRYGNTETERFRAYLKKARDLAEQLLPLV